MGVSDGNPFSTRYTQPGALPFRFDTDESAERLVARLRQANWWGQILGPHGAGKTTLLKTLIPLLDQVSRRVELHTLRGGERKLPERLRGGWHDRDGQVQVIVDGYEQLGHYARWTLQRRCRRSGAGLLVTSHQDVGLPTLMHVQPTVELLVELAHRLLVGQPLSVSDDEIAACYERCQGNLRESLFALYDLYELRRRQQ